MDLQRKKNITFTIQLLTLNGLTTFQRIEKCGQHNIFFSEHTWELTPPSHTPKLSKSYHSCSVNMNGNKFTLDEAPWDRFLFPSIFTELTWENDLH